MKRTLGPNWHKDPGCQHQPLFNIPPKDIIIDELHLMLRVTDRLEQGLILEVIDWDEVCDCSLSTFSNNVYWYMLQTFKGHMNQKYKESRWLLGNIN